MGNKPVTSKRWKDTLNPLKNELSHLLENGLQIEFNKKIEKYIVKIAQVTSDNQALNNFMGIQINFTGGHPCRICDIKLDPKTGFENQRKPIMRTQLNQKLKERGYLKLHPLYIRDKPLFDIHSVIPLDAMHDLLSHGVLGRTMSLIIKDMVKNKLIEKQTIMDRCQNLKFGFMKARINESYDIIGTASEILQYFICFPRIVSCNGWTDKYYGFNAYCPFD